MKTKLMTKLALAAAVVAFGLGAQAEMLYWRATGIKSSTDNPLTSEDSSDGTGKYIAYIFADTGSGATSGATPNMFSKTGGNNPITSLTTIKEMLANKEDITSLAYYNSKGVRSYEKTKGRLNNYTAASETAEYDAQVGWIGQYGVVNLFAVILDGTSFDDAENYMIARTTAGKEVLTLETNSNAESTNMKDVYFDWGSQEKNSWYKIGTVPEPTSGILLALGVAALALKRKHAA